MKNLLRFRPDGKFLLVAGLICAMHFADTAQAVTIATEGFDYANGALAGQNGGAGWSAAWTAAQGAPIATNGQASINSAAGDQAERILPAQGTAGTVIWLRFSAQQFSNGTGPDNTYGGFGLFNGSTEQLLIGKTWPGNYVWAAGVGSSVTNSTFSTLVPTVVYVCITFVSKSSNTLQVWLNPANTNSIQGMGTPSISLAATNYSFDRIRLRGGTGVSVNESWLFDKLAVASSFADLSGTPSSPPPGTPVLLAYDGFMNYTAGNLPGQSFAGAGFASGAWAGTSANAATVTTNGGLTAYLVAYGGGKVTVKGDGSVTWGQLNLGTGSALAAAGLYDANSGTVGGGGVSGVLYLSFLFRAVSTDRHNEYGGLQLERGTNNSAGILIGNNTNGWAYSLYNTDNGASIDLLSSGGSGSYLTMDNNAHLFVAKITYITNGADNITVWLDPDPDSGETNQPSTTYTGSATGNFSFDHFALCGGWNATGSPHQFDFDEIRFGTTWTNVLPPGPPPPQLTNSQINITFNGDGTIQAMAVLRSNVWEAVSFRTDGFAGPAWKISDGSGTRSDPLMLAYPASIAVTGGYTNLVFTGSDSYNANLQLALQYQLSSNQLVMVASVTNTGSTAWLPVQAGLLMGLDTYMASYPSWDYLYFPTLLRCEKTHFWGYAMTPLGRILGFASPNPVASWHNEYEGGGHRIYTFGLDFLNQLPLPARHPQDLTVLQPNQGMRWTVLLGDLPNNDPVSVDSVLPALASMSGAPMIKASRYTGQPGDTVNFYFWGNPVGGSLQTPDGVMHPLTLTASSNGMAKACFMLPATYGLCNLLVTNAAGRIAQGSVNVRQPWSWYLKQARVNALNKPQKDAGAQCEGYYGFYSMFLAKHWFPDAVLDPQSDAKFNELYPLMFSTNTGLPTYNAGRIQNSAAMAGILSDRYIADGNITNLNRAAALCDFLLTAQGADGGYYNGGDYTSVIYPGKSIMEVMVLEQALGQTNTYWHGKYTNHYNSVLRAMNHLASNLDNIGTEGEATFEDGMISCSGAQLGMFALLETNGVGQQYYQNAAAWFETAHRCLDQIVVPDASHNGGTERFWEDQYDIIASPNLLCSPQGWSGWDIYGRWYLYQLTGNVEYLRQAMNALGACTQLIDPVSGNLSWAFCTDPFIQANLFTNNPANTNPNTQGTHIAQTIGEQYLPMISGWCLAPYDTQVSLYSGNDGGCNDNDVHEIFKCLEEVALTSAYLVIHADGSVETWNCTATNINNTLLVTPSESIVSRINVNAAVGTNVSLNFNGQITTRFLTGIGWQQAPVLLNIQNLGGSNMQISWTSTGTLQQAAAITGPWTNSLNQAIPQTVSATNSALFFRLSQ